MSDPVLSIVETEQLMVACESRGPSNAPPVLLLHGWPDDVRTWDGVAGQLAEKGFRVLVPFLRGFGPTRFREASTSRTGQPSALACDARQLLDAFGLPRVTVVGHDWGARAAYVLAALWPERVERLITLAVGYETGIKPGWQLDYAQQRAYWYQWFFASERGREALLENRRGFCEFLWRTWSPTWRFTEAEFLRTAQSWENPDWVEITLHSYRMRWGNAPADPKFAELEARMNEHPPISVPTVQLHGAQDGAALADAVKDQEKSFPNGYRRRIVPEAGHFIPRECPLEVVKTILTED
jgi:pimeloyl-ACP methyl ester carboxylesterase